MKTNLYISYLITLLFAGLSLQTHAQSVDGGIISYVDGDTVLNICVPQDTGLMIDAVLSSNTGENSLWVITDTSGLILDTLNVPTFAVANYTPLIYQIWHLSAVTSGQAYPGIHKDSIQGSYDYSNSLIVSKTVVSSGILSLIQGDTIIGCNGDQVPDSLIFNVEGDTGEFGKYVVLDTFGNIEKVLSDSIVITDSISIPVCQVRHLTYQQIENLAAGVNVSQLIGCYAFSNPITITKTLIEGGDIWLLDDRTQITICVGDGISDAFTPFLDNEIGSNSKWIIASDTDTILAVITFNTFNLEGIDPGYCKIYHISYDGIVDNLSAGSSLYDLTGCFDLSNKIDVFKISGETETGVLDLLTSGLICSGDGVPDTTSVTLSDYVGDSLKYLVVNTSGEIIMISDTSEFYFEDINSNTSVTIYAISYLTGLDRLEVGISIDKLEGCYSLSNPITINISFVNGGVIMASDSSLILTICSGDQLPDTTFFLVNDTMGSFFTYFIYDKNGNIVQRFDTDTVDLDVGMSDTTYLVLVASSDSIPHIDHIDDLSGCYNTSNVLEILNSSGEVLANELNLTSPYVSCVTPGNADTLFLPGIGDIGIFQNYIITDLNDNIVVIYDSDTVDLSILELNQYKLYNFSGNQYISGLAQGTSILDIKGCYDLSAPVIINFQEVNGGILSIDSLNSDIICLGNDGSEDILMQLDSAIGQTQFYIVTDSLGTIIDASTNPLITIDRYGMDSLLVWSLMYNDIIDGLVKDSSVYNLAGCFDLSEPVLILPSIVNGGQISFEGNADSLIFCSSLNKDFIDINIEGNRGDKLCLAFANQAGEFFHLQDSLRFRPSDFLEEELILVVYSGLDSFFIENGVVQSIDDCYTASNFIRLINKYPIGGSLSFDDSLKSKSICLIPDSETNIQLNLNENRGSYFQYLFLDQSLDTILITDTSSVLSVQLPADTLSVVAFSYSDSINENVIPCYAVSDTIQLIIHRIDGGQLIFNDSTVQKVSCLGDSVGVMLSNETGSSNFILILDADSTIIGFGSQVDSFNLMNLNSGSYQIVHLSGVDYSIDSSFIGLHKDSLFGCFHLSNTLEITIDEAYSDPLELELIERNISCDSLITVDYTFSQPDSILDQLKYLVLDSNDMVVALFDTSGFKFNYDQDYKVYLINYKTAPIPFGVGIYLKDIKGCFNLSNEVELPQIYNDAGNISFTDFTLERDFCGVGISIDTIDILLDHLGHINRYWVVTNTSGEILDTFSQLPVLINNNGPDSCFIYHMAYFNEESTPYPDSNIVVLKGCYNLSNPLLVTKSLIRGGEILANGAKEVTICTGDQTIDQVHIDISFPAGAGSAWVITDEFENITSLSTVAPNNFNNLPEGTCFLRHIRFQPGNVQGLFLGVNIENIEGCFEFSDSIRINKNIVNGGILMTADSLMDIVVCVDDETEENIQPLLSEQKGDTSRWFLTNNFGEIIEIDLLPPYNFEGDEPGQCFIWNVSYTGAIQGLELGNIISDLEGCLAISNPVRIRKRAGLDCLTSTEDLGDFESIHMYPNPTFGSLEITNSNYQKGIIEFSDIQGQPVYLEKISGSPFQFIDISHLSPGIYYAKVLMKNKSYIIPIVKL